MGRVLPVTKSFKSLIPRKPPREVKPINEYDCPICGKKRVNEICPNCLTYHSPQKCEGEGCKICEEIIFIKEHSKKEFIIKKTVDKEVKM